MFPKQTSRNKNNNTQQGGEGTLILQHKRSFAGNEVFWTRYRATGQWSFRERSQLNAGSRDWFQVSKTTQLSKNEAAATWTASCGQKRLVNIERTVPSRRDPSEIVIFRVTILFLACRQGIFPVLWKITNRPNTRLIEVCFTSAPWSPVANPWICLSDEQCGLI